MIPRFLVRAPLAKNLHVRWATTSASSLATGPQTAVGGDTNNAKTETNRLEKTMSKFWENVTITLNDATQEYEIKLDDKSLKTPLGHKLLVPKLKRELAHLVNHEWSSLVDLRIKPNSLPLTSMVSRTVDLTKVHHAEKVDANLVSKVGDLLDIKLNMLRYLDTDTCLIFTTLDDNEGRLRARQEELYRPLIEEYEHFFTAFARKHNLLASQDDTVTLQSLDCEKDGLRGNSQLITTQNVVLKWLDKLPIYDLVALEKAILSSKSFLCGVTILRSNVACDSTRASLYQINKLHPSEYYRKTVEEVVEMGNLETIYQTAEWGEVEDTHDVDKVDWLRNLSAAALVCR